MCLMKDIAMSPGAGCSLDVLYSIASVDRVLPASKRVFSITKLEMVNMRTLSRTATRELLATIKVRIVQV